MKRDDIGKPVTAFIKRLDGRIFVVYGMLVDFDETHCRVRTHGHDEDLLRVDLQRIVYENVNVAGAGDVYGRERFGGK